MELNKLQRNWNESSKWDFSDLKAVIINCTLKKSPERSHTEGLISVVEEILKANKVSVENIRAVDHDIATGVYVDMTKQGWDKDDWPKIFEKVMSSNILILGSPIWLGQASSVCQRVIERLYGQSGELNEYGQYVYYGRVGGAIITGNEDGVKHCAMGMLYSLQHLGFTIPPQADAGWIGEIGPGLSYSDEGSGGPENDFTNRNTTFMIWNLMHLARILKGKESIPAHGNQRSVWDAGRDPNSPNPEYR